jgi:hypothetical protein
MGINRVLEVVESFLGDKVRRVEHDCLERTLEESDTLESITDASKLRKVMMYWKKKSASKTVMYM